MIEEIHKRSDRIHFEIGDQGRFGRIGFGRRPERIMTPSATGRS
jgi:hypothetical protein